MKGLFIGEICTQQHRFYGRFSLKKTGRLFSVYTAVLFLVGESEPF